MALSRDAKGITLPPYTSPLSDNFTILSFVQYLRIRNASRKLTREECENALNGILSFDPTYAVNKDLYRDHVS